MSGRQGAGCAFAMHAELLRMSVDIVGLELGQVVRDVVDQCDRRLTNHGAERLAYAPRDHLAVGAPEVGGRRHSGEVAPAMARIDGRRRELRVRQCDAVDRQRLDHLTYVVAADLVTQPSRTGVDHHGDLAFVQPKSLCDSRLEDPLYDLDLDQVVSRIKAAKLAQPAFGGALADLAEVADWQSALILAALEVLAVSIALWGSKSTSRARRQWIECAMTSER